MGYYFPSRLTATLNLCLIYFKITRVLATLLEHMHRKFEINRTKIKGGYLLGTKVVTHDSKCDLPLTLLTLQLAREVFAVLFPNFTQLSFKSSKTSVVYVHWRQKLKQNHGHRQPSHFSQINCKNSNFFLHLQRTLHGFNLLVLEANHS